MKRIAVLAVQGAFIEHEYMLESLGAEVCEIRQLHDLQKSYDGIILPGGESTVQGKLLRINHMLLPLKEQIEAGIPTLGTCAGMILMSQYIKNDKRYYLQTMPITVKRNAYGRQLESFIRKENMKNVGTIPMNFIRAPYIEKISDKVEILASIDQNIVAAQYQKQIVLSFHPEVTGVTKVHEYFLSMI